MARIYVCCFSLSTRWGKCLLYNPHHNLDSPYYYKDFLNNIREEVTDVVRRLNYHPSIVLWSGNNENQVSWDTEIIDVTFVIN